MNKNTLIAVILGVAAAIAFVLFYTNYSARQDLLRQQETEQARLEALEAERAELTREAEAARSRAEALRREAEEAARMAAAKVAEEEALRQQELAELNTRLQREAAERRAAEEQATRLQQSLDELARVQAEAEARLAELEQARAGGAAGPDELTLREQLRQQEENMARLQAENDQLRERQQVLASRQMETEEEILRRGGELWIPSTEVMSLNYRRREALLNRNRYLRLNPDARPSAPVEQTTEQP